MTANFKTKNQEKRVSQRGQLKIALDCSEMLLIFYPWRCSEPCLFTKCLKQTRPKVSLCRFSLMTSRLSCFFPTSSISSLSCFHFDKAVVYIIYIRFLKVSNKSIILKIFGEICNPQVLKDIQRFESHPFCERVNLFHVTLQETEFESSSWHYILALY